MPIRQDDVLGLEGGWRRFQAIKVKSSGCLGLSPRALGRENNLLVPIDSCSLVFTPLEPCGHSAESTGVKLVQAQCAVCVTRS